MKYILLVYEDEKRRNAMSTRESDAFADACSANDEMLHKSGHLLAVKRLQHSSTAATVRVQNGQVFLTDGPFTTTTEQITRLFYIQARDLNEAIRVAAKMPQAQQGAIEVRSIMDFEHDVGAKRHSPVQ